MKLVILDRDGVVNEESDAFVKSPDEWIPIPGSLDAIVRLNHAGYRVAVATNQSGIGRGLFDIGTLNAIHQKMNRELDKKGGHVDGIFFCPHRPEDNCACRKPRTGLLDEIIARFHSDLTGVPAIGDGLRDITAYRAAGATPYLVRSGRGAATLHDHPDLVDEIPVFDDLAAAVDAILTADEDH